MLRRNMNDVLFQTTGSGVILIRQALVVSFGVKSAIGQQKACKTKDTVPLPVADYRHHLSYGCFHSGASTFGSPRERTTTKLLSVLPVDSAGAWTSSDGLSSIRPFLLR